MITASVVEWLESMTSNQLTSLAWVRSPGDALVVYGGGKGSVTCSFQERLWF